MKNWHFILIGLCGGLIATGLILLIALPEQGIPVTLNTPLPEEFSQPTNPASPALIWVHMAGQVKSPGVYTLPSGSRLRDGLNAAGGLTELADLDRINLAAILTDGTRFYIPANGEDLPVDSIGDIPSAAKSESIPLININTATVNELMTLPGIGTTKAGAIVLHRSEHGQFTEIAEVMDVVGIGEGIFEIIKDLITIGP